MKHEGDVAKLPKWAQRHIANLERQADEMKASLAVGPENSNTFADPYFYRKPLGRDERVRWEDASGQAFFDVAVRSGLLQIQASGPAKISPHATNMFYVEVERWKA